MKAGFESITYQDTLRDERWKLAGRPWRVLRKGGMRIPVFLMRRGNKVKFQHIARMAAYCHLIETCEGAESPYGIVLFNGTYDGIAIPNAPGPRKAFHSALVKSRKIINDSIEGKDPEPPSNRQICYYCPNGRPVSYIPGETEHKKMGEPLPVHIIPAFPAGYDFHSACGDRFRWVAPHEKVLGDA